MFRFERRHLRCARIAELEGGGTTEAGFTLIELMVVLLIIAILLAIAIPTFLGVTGSANDRAVQSNLTNALTEASAAYQANSQSFPAVAAMQGSAPEFTWTTATTTAIAGSNVISMEPVDVAANGDGKGIILADESKNSSTCWFALTLNATPVTTLTVAGDTGGVPFESTTPLYTETGAAAAGTYYAKLPNAGSNCKASYAQTTGFAWGPSYANPGAA